jgi:hypothetical protein
MQLGSRPKAPDVAMGAFFCEHWNGGTPHCRDNPRASPSPHASPAARKPPFLGGFSFSNSTSLAGTSSCRRALYGRHRHLLARRPALRSGREVTAGALLNPCPDCRRQKPNASGNSAIVQIGTADAPPRVRNDSWYPIESAPFDEDVTVEVTHGRGGPYALRWPCRQTTAGWINSAKGTPLAVTPVRWRPYHPPPDQQPQSAR